MIRIHAHSNSNLYHGFYLQILVPDIWDDHMASSQMSWKPNVINQIIMLDMRAILDKNSDPAPASNIFILNAFTFISTDKEYPLCSCKSTMLG